MTRLLLALAALAAIAFGAPAFAQKPDRVYLYEEQDAAMSEAVAQARASYAQFLAVFRAARESERDRYMVKIGMPTPMDQPEHIWVDGLHFEGEALVGALANEPAYLPGLHRGARVVVETDAISDWSIMTAQGMFGNFTTRVMLPVLPPAEADHLRRLLTPNPIPDEWRI